MSPVIEILLIFLITQAGFVELGKYALEYHIVKYRATPEMVDFFLDKLKFPARLWYADTSNRKLFLKLAQENLTGNHTQTTNDKKIARIVFSMIPIFPMLASIISLVTGRVETNMRGYVIVWLIAACLGLYKAWRFGSVLKAMNPSIMADSAVD